MEKANSATRFTVTDPSEQRRRGEAVSTVRGPSLTYLVAPRQIPSVDVTTYSPMLLCTVRHAAWILTRHKVRRDTSDAVREDSWTENRQEILQLGVQVLARRPGGSVNQLLPPWSLRLGRDTLSGEHLVGTPAGVVRRWAVRRLQEAARRVPEALKAVLLM